MGVSTFFVGGAIWWEHTLLPAWDIASGNSAWCVSGAWVLDKYGKKGSPRRRSRARLRYLSTRGPLRTIALACDRHDLGMLQGRRALAEVNLRLLARCHFDPPEW